MNGRLVAVIGLMLAMTGFAGCIEAISFLSTGDDEITAGENRDLADNAAAAWNPDAKLMGVFALENANTTDMFPSDPDVGNGKAVLWFYGYAAKNGTEARAFQVSAAGEVQAMNESLGEVPTDVGEPIGAWEIDSDRAVEIARGNASFNSFAAAENTSMMEALGAEDGMTVWAIMAGSETGQAIAIIDALTGDIIMVEVFKLDFDMPAIPGYGDMGMGMPYDGPQVDIEDAQTLDMGTPSYEYPFTLERGDSASLMVDYETMLPTDGLSFLVTDAEENVVAEGRITGFMGSSGSEFAEFAIEEAGDYVLTFVYESRAVFLPVPVPLGSAAYDMHFVVGAMCEETAAESGSGMSMTACVTSTSAGGR
jgi:hypothetical protein